MATKTKTAKGSKKQRRMESSNGARDRRREVPLPKPKERSRLAREIAILSKLTKSQLWKRHEEVFGHKSRSCNTKQLIDVIARRLVEQVSNKGKKSALPALVTEGTVAASTTSSTTTERDPRLPKVGTVLEREHNGKMHRVTVLDDGFEYEGEKHRSLSGLAKQITGAIWNGWVFFGIVKRGAQKKEASNAA